MKFFSIPGLLLLCLFAQGVQGQDQQRLDSIVKLIEDRNTHDTARAKAYLDLSELLYLSNIDTMLTLCEKAIAVAKNGMKGEENEQIKLSFRQTLAASYNNMGYVYGEKGDVEQQIKYYKKGLSFAELMEDKEAIAIFLNNFGLIYRTAGKLDTALNYYERALKISEEIGDDVGLANTFALISRLYDVKGDVKQALKYSYESLKINEKIGDKGSIAFNLNNIGYLYQNQEDYEQALSNYTQSLEIYRELGHPRGISSSLNNLGRIHYLMKDGVNALKYYTESLEIREQIDYKKAIAVSLINIANVYYNIGEPDCRAEKAVCIELGKKKALKYYLRSLEINTEIGDKYGLTYSYNALADIYFEIGQTDRALKHAKQAYEIATEIGYTKNLSVSSSTLSEIYAKKGNYMAALDFFKNHIQLRDSLSNEETQKETAKQQAKYAYEKQKAIDDAEYEKQLAIEHQEKEKQTILTYTTGGGLGLVGIFLIIVFNRLKVTRRQKNIIQEQKIEVERQKEVVEVAHEELEEKNKEITDSIQYAKRIQSAILPPDKLVKEYLHDSFILYKPKDIVAGDFYWMHCQPADRETAKSDEYREVSDEKNNATRKTQRTSQILFAAADCTGHGVPGAMVSVVCNNGLNRSVREFGLTDPGKILDKTREIVIQEFEKSEEDVKDGMDIALCSLENIGDERGMLLKYAGAHNPLWIIREVRKEIKDDLSKYAQQKTEHHQLFEIKADKQPIGKFDNPRPHTTHTVELCKGDTVYIFSDGFADQFGGEKGKKLKTINFKKLLLSIQEEPITKQKQLIDEAFEKWKGSIEQLDDVCIIGVRV